MTGAEEIVAGLGTVRGWHEDCYRDLHRRTNPEPQQRPPARALVLVFVLGLAADVPLDQPDRRRRGVDRAHRRSKRQQAVGIRILKHQTRTAPRTATLWRTGAESVQGTRVDGAGKHISDTAKGAMDMQPGISERDEYLADIIRRINGLGEPLKGGLAIIISVNGTVIAGEVIPGWQWFGEVVDQYRDVAEEAGLEFAEEELIGLGALFGQWRERSRAEGDVEQAKHIHLRGARLVVPWQSPFPSKGRFWRGRLSEINGWTIGRPLEP